MATKALTSSAALVLTTAATLNTVWTLTSAAATVTSATNAMWKLNVVGEILKIPYSPVFR